MAYHTVVYLALFLGFFQQIMEGSISMYSQTADVLWEGDPLKGENLSKGSVRILWGLMDIVIGSGRMFGVTLPENFNQPFASGNAAEFWRR